MKRERKLMRYKRERDNEKGQITAHVRNIDPKQQQQQTPYRKNEIEMRENSQSSVCKRRGFASLRGAFRRSSDDPALDAVL